MPGRRMPYAPKSLRTGGLMGFENLADIIAEEQVGVRHNTRIQLTNVILSNPLLRNLLHEFRFTDGPQGVASPLPVFGTTFDEDGLLHPMTADVAKEFFAHIAAIRSIPLVVMGITNAEIRVEWLFLAQIEPALVDPDQPDSLSAQEQGFSASSSDGTPRNLRPLP